MNSEFIFLKDKKILHYVNREDYDYLSLLWALKEYSECYIRLK